MLGKSRRMIIVENNCTGQFARHLRAGDRHRRTGPHPQVRRRTVRAQACGGWREGDLGGAPRSSRCCPPSRDWQTEHPTGTTGDWPGRRVRAGANRLASVESAGPRKAKEKEVGTAAAAVKEFKSEVPSDWGVGAWPRASVVAAQRRPLVYLAARGA